jgi:hypothetical protein
MSSFVRSLTPRHVVLASMAAWFVCVLLQWLTDPPLSHDEAAYALLARDGQHTWLYRPIGSITLARIGLALEHSELALRATSVVIGLSLVPAVAYLGRRFGAWTGAWAAAIVAGSHPFLLRGFQLLNDIPAAACVIVATAIAIDELDRSEGPSYRLVLVAPLCAAAIYLRYGAVLTIGVVALAAAVLFRSWLRRPGPVVVTACAFIALLVPLLVYSHDKTGSAVGLFEAARNAADVGVGRGLARFVLSNPLTFYGVLVTPMLIVGLFGARWTDRRARFLAISAIAVTAWLGLFSAGDVRFVFVPIVFLVILGVRCTMNAIATRPRLQYAAGVVIVASWLVMIAAAVPLQRYKDRWLASMVTTSAAIRSDAAGRPCIVVSYRIVQLQWYTGCEVVRAPAMRWADPQRADARWYVTELPTDPVRAADVAHGLGVQAVPLWGGAAWYLDR